MIRIDRPQQWMATARERQSGSGTLCRYALVSGLLALCQLPLAGSALALADQRDTQALFSALNDLMQFAAPGRSVTWENPTTGNKGEVEAVRRNDAIGRICWDYERTYPEAGRVMGVTGTACEVTTGLWEIVEEGTPFRVGTGTAATTSTPKAAPASSKPSYDRAMVRETQALLTELGYQPGPVDGAYGRKTGGAISAYQRDKGKTVDSKPSQALLTDLRSDVRNKVATRTETPTQDQTPGTQQPAQEPESLPWLKPSIPDETRPAGPADTTAKTESQVADPTPTPTPSAIPSTAPTSSSTTTTSGSASESDAGVWVPPPPPPPAE